MKTSTLFILLVLAIGGNTSAQHFRQTEKLIGSPNITKFAIFYFIAGSDMFYIPMQGNGDQLNELVAAVDRHKSAIMSGRAHLYVDGYCASFSTDRENKKSASIRANRVKSELILRCGVREEHFTTKVYPFTNIAYQSVVEVRLYVSDLSDVNVGSGSTQVVLDTQTEPGASISEDKSEAENDVGYQIVEEKPLEVLDSYTKDLNSQKLSLRANLLPHLALVPSAGVEWGIVGYGLVLDLGGSYWGSRKGSVQKLWYVSPEVRRYLGSEERWYVGAGATYSKYNLYRLVVGSLLSSDTGYQGRLWSVGVTAGYRLPLSSVLDIDFNLGIGYTDFSYDSFTLVSKVRVYKEPNLRNSYWGVNRVGVSLVWKIVK